MIKRVFLLCCSGLIFAFALSADTFSFGYSGQADPDCSNTGGCAAGATITTGTNTLEIQLQNFVGNPKSSGQLVSGIWVTLTTSATSASSLTSQLGQLIDIDGQGVVTDVSGDPTHWAASNKNSTTICLGTIGPNKGCGDGGSPEDLIIGNASSYPNANSSVGNTNPLIQGIGTFIINVPGINADTIVTSVDFLFGTGAADGGPITTSCTAGTAGCGGVPFGDPVPEPTSIVLLGSISLGLASVFRKKFRRTV